jgi:signal transduction histidine kinase
MTRLAKVHVNMRGVRAVLLSAGFIMSFPGRAALSETVSDLTHLIQVAEANPYTHAALEVEGTVWWSSGTKGHVILNDGTSSARIELDIPCRIPRPGERIRLTGECIVIKARDYIKLLPVPVVENGGLHAAIEKTGTLSLTAGDHLFRLVWFNRTADTHLDVEVEGPGISRQPIPSEWLFSRVAASESGLTNRVNGLNYQSYEGRWWRLIPNFEHIPAVESGFVHDFSIGIGTRGSHVGLRFEGLLKVPQDGEYTFYITSDDGSRLFIGPPSLNLHAVGTAALPDPVPLSLRDAGPRREEEFVRADVEGMVTSLHRPGDMLEFEMKTDVGFIRVLVAEDATDSYTLRPHNRVRAVGISRRTRNADGERIAGELFVQRWEDVEQEYVTPAIWSEYPVVDIADLLEDEKHLDQTVVHLQGRIVRDGPTFVMDDGSARLRIADTDTEQASDSLMDVLGRVTRDGPDRLLNDVYYRPVTDAEVDKDRLPLLTRVEQIFQLSPEDAAKGYPVSVRGVITSPLEDDTAILQDGSKGIFMSLGGPINLQVGDYCEVEGTTGPYVVAQYILASRVKILGSGSLPEPIHPTWDQLINGSLHCDYVELEGVVTSIYDNSISLLTRGGRINIRLSPIGQKLPDDALGATVRLRGCLLADWDQESHRVVVGSVFLVQHWVSVLLSAPIDPFAVPLKRVGDLLRYDPDAGALQRVKVSGQVVYKDPVQCYVMDEGNGLRFTPSEKVASEVGDTVEVVGFVELGEVSPVLQEAQVRTVGRDSMPVPLRLDADALLKDEYDSALVQVDGVLLEVIEKPDRIVLEMQSGLRRFAAEIREPSGALSELHPGSTLKLTGIYAGQGGNRVLGQPIKAFTLLLNSAMDVQVLSYPHWWTFRRILILTGMLAAVLIAALVWINLLHRRVEQRTEELGNVIRQRQRAERQRELEQERARLAHDLHDDLGSRLTEVDMLVSLFNSPATTPEEKEHYAAELSDRVMDMVNSLDEIVWAVNPRNDTLSLMVDYFGLYAQRLLELASINWSFDVSEDLPDMMLDPRFRQEVFLAFKEALTNVIQHAGAHRVRLQLDIEGEDLIVIVSDDGSGIGSDLREAGADGLENMKTRMASLGGHCSVQSDQQTGTTVRLQAPLQKAQV